MLAETSLQIGRPVLLAGFPAAVDEDLPNLPEGLPLMTYGHISCFSASFELVAATYQGGKDQGMLLQVAGHHVCVRTTFTCKLWVKCLTTIYMRSCEQRMHR